MHLCMIVSCECGVVFVTSFGLGWRGLKKESHSFHFFPPLKDDGSLKMMCFTNGQSKYFLSIKYDFTKLILISVSSEDHCPVKFGKKKKKKKKRSLSKILPKDAGVSSQT